MTHDDTKYEKRNKHTSTRTCLTNNHGNINTHSNNKHNKATYTHATQQPNTDNTRTTATHNNVNGITNKYNSGCEKKNKDRGTMKQQQ